MTELTKNQSIVVAMLAENMTTKEIARALGISPQAVDNRIASAVRKLGLNNRRELARLVRSPTMRL